MDSAQFASFDADPSLAERDNSATGNITDAPVYTGPGSGDNPDGNTPTGEGVDNTGTEQAPDSTPPANNVTQDIPGPDVPEGGGSGGLAEGSTVNEAPEEPTVPQNGVPQNDPELADATPLAAAAAPEPNPGLAVEKSVNGVYAIDPETGELVLLEGETTVTEAGQVVGYLITVANTGDQDLTGVVVTDPLANYGLISLIGGDLDSDNVLDVGETWIYQAYHQFSQAEIDAGGNLDSDLNGFFDQFENLVTVDSDQTGPVSDTVTIALEENALIDVEKFFVSLNDGDGIANAGETITFSFTVQNVGNVTLDLTAFLDSLANAGFVLDSANPVGTELAVGADALELTGTYTLTQADIDRGSVTNAIVVEGLSEQGARPTDTDSVTVPIGENALIDVEKFFVSLNDGDGIANAGETITFSFTVQNVGNVTLDLTAFLDSLANAGFVLDSANPVGTELAVGADALELTGTYTLTQADIDRGSVTNAIVVEGLSEQGARPTDTDSVTVPIGENALIDVEKFFVSLNDGDGIANAGETITFSFTVQNVGNVTLDLTAFLDSLANAGFVLDSANPVGTELAVGADALELTGTYTLTQADIDRGSVTNAIVVEGLSEQGARPTDTDSVTVPIGENALIDVEKFFVSLNDGDGIANAGETITFSFTVQNVGNVTLDLTAFLDSLANAGFVLDSANPVGTELAVGADALELTGTYTLTQADIDRGSVTNAIVVEGLSEQGARPTDTDSVTVPIGENALIDVEKFFVSLNDGDGIANAGETITFSFTVQNVGNVTLDLTAFLDSLANAGFVLDSANPVGTELAVGADALELTGTYTLTQADIDRGSVTNAIVVEGLSEQGARPTDTDSVTVPIGENALIDVEKFFVSLNDGDGIANAGETITFSFTVQNVGNVTLDLTAFLDSLANAGFVLDSANPVGTELAVGADALELTGTYTLTQADIDRGSVTNAIVVEGLSEQGARPTDTDSVTVPIGENALIDVEKFFVSLNDGDGIANAGETITFSFTVQNVGNVTLDLTAFLDSLANAGFVLDSANPVGTELAVGADALELTGTYTLTQADIDRGSVTNAIVVEGLSEQGARPTDTDSVTVPIGENALIDVEKFFVSLNDGDGIANAGETITFSFTVQNVGNVTLDLTAFLDSLANAGFVLDSANPVGTELAVGADALELTGTYTLTQADIDRGSVTNAIVVEGLSEQGARPTDTDSVTVEIIQNPEIVLTKTYQGWDDLNQDGFLSEGDKLFYSFYVFNSGNVSLYDVSLIDNAFDLTGPIIITFDNSVLVYDSTADLAPNQSIVLDGTYVIQTGDLASLYEIGDIFIDNTAYAQAVQDNGSSTTSVLSNASTATAILPIVVDDESLEGGILDGIGDTSPVFPDADESFLQFTISGGSVDSFSIQYTIDTDSDDVFDSAILGNELVRYEIVDNVFTVYAIGSIASGTEYTLYVDGDLRFEIPLYTVEGLDNLPDTYKLTLVNNILHPAAPANNENLGYLQQNLYYTGDLNGDNIDETILIPVVFNDDTPETTAEDATQESSPGDPVVASGDWNANLGADTISNPDEFILAVNVKSVKVDADGDQTYETTVVTYSNPLTFNPDTGKWEGSYEYDYNQDGAISSSEQFKYTLDFTSPTEYVFETTSFGSVELSSAEVASGVQASGPSYAYVVQITDAETGLIFNSEITSLSYWYNNPTEVDPDGVAAPYTFWSLTGPDGTDTYILGSYTDSGTTTYNADGELIGVSQGYSVNSSAQGIGVAGNNMDSTLTGGGTKVPLQVEGVRFDPNDLDGSVNQVTIEIKDSGGTGFGTGPSDQDTMNITVVGANNLEYQDQLTSFVAKYEVTVSSEYGDYVRYNYIVEENNILVERWTDWTEYTADVNMISRTAQGDPLYEDYTGGQVSYADGEGYTLFLYGNVSSIDYVDIVSGYNYDSTSNNWVSSSFKMYISYSVSVPSSFADPTQFNFEVVTTDSDADTASAEFSVNIVPPPEAAPVILDFGRSLSIDYVSLANSSFSYDLNGDGVLDRSAWIGSNEAVLVFDANTSGSVDHYSEFVFAPQGSGLTDLQALASQAYDVNLDGFIDASDSTYDLFGVWSDFNGDGLFAESEFISLAEAGISFISLRSDGLTSELASGDVTVHGTGSFQWVDGESGMLHDTSFAYDTGASSPDSSSYPSVFSSDQFNSVDQLVASYLDSMATSADTDGSGELSVAELAYGLDYMVSSFVDNYGLSIEDHAVIQQDVYNQLAHELNDLSVDDGIDIAFDAAGDANGADVLAALDQHFMEIHDAHVVPVDSYDDPGSMV